MTQPSLFVSVVVPSHAPRFLEQVMRGLASQSVNTFEVILVVNGDLFEVDGLLGRYGKDLRLRCVHEPAIGLNRARNAGVTVARGHVVAFLDDDAVPTRRWIETIGSLHERYVEDSIIGGEVRLHFLSASPQWLIGELRWLLSEISWTHGTYRLDDGKWLAGCNLSVKKSLFEQVGMFDESIGMKGRTGPQLGNDETEFVARAGERTGIGPLFSSELVVDHIIPETRLSIENLRLRAWGQGYSTLGPASTRKPLGDQEALADNLSRCLMNATAHRRRLEEGKLDLDPDNGRIFRDCMVICRIAYLEGMRCRIDEAQRDAGSDRENWYRKGWREILGAEQSRDYRNSRFEIVEDYLYRRLRSSRLNRCEALGTVSFLAGMCDAARHAEA